MLRTLVLGFAVLAVGAPVARADGDAARVKALLDKADMIYRGTTSAAVFTMHVKTRAFTRDYDIVVWDDGRHDRTLVKILGPALWRGFGTLKIGDGLKLYDPRANRVTVVGQSMLGDSWMGSHFSNDDLVKETHLARDYDARLVGHAPTTVAGQPATQDDLRLTPRPTAPVAWGRIDYRIVEAGDRVLPVRAAYYRKAGDARPVRTITFTDVTDLGGRAPSASPGETSVATCAGRSSPAPRSRSARRSRSPASGSPTG